MSSQEVKRKHFQNCRFLDDRTFIGTIRWDDKDYWSTKSGPNSFWEYSIKLNSDSTRVESGKLMYVDSNHDIIDYKFYGRRTFYYDAKDKEGVQTSGEMSYIQVTCKIF